MQEIKISELPDDNDPEDFERTFILLYNGQPCLYEDKLTVHYCNCSSNRTINYLVTFFGYEDICKIIDILDLPCFQVINIDKHIIYCSYTGNVNIHKFKDKWGNVHKIKQVFSDEYSCLYKRYRKREILN